MPHKKTALVTGGAGFIGSQLAERLIKEGFHVVVVDNLSSGKREYVPKAADFHQLEISSPEVSELIVELKPDFVFHLAAQIDLRYSVAQPIHDAETNIHGSLRVLEGCVSAGVKKIIFSSSGGAIYHGISLIPTPENVPCFPKSPYGVAKLSFELYLHAACHNYNQAYVALRYANVYGPRQDMRGEAGVIGIFTQKILAGEPLMINGDGEQTRDFVYVDDVVEANIKAMNDEVHGVFNIGTGVETSVNQVVAHLVDAARLPCKPKHRDAVAGEERRSALNISSAKAALGWKPKVDVKEGIKRTVQWFQEKNEG